MPGTKVLNSALLFFVISAALMPTLLPNVSSVDRAVSGEVSTYECGTLYFFNGIAIFNSTLTQELMLETPYNITLRDGFEQVVEHILSYNLVFNDTAKAFTFRAEANKSFEGFFISKVKICSREMNSTLSTLLFAYQYPTYLLSPGGEIPTEVIENYLREPSKKVIESLIPAYEKWFKSKYNIQPKNASQLGIASTASYFIYSVYLEYAAEALPRTIDEVIDTRRGDCDDMSRVLVELLSYFGIPSVIVWGYVYIHSFNYTSPVENVTYKFINNGPHAFVMAYIAGMGWVSSDWLAGSLLTYPFIGEDYSRETAVVNEAIVEFVELHKEINATQIFVVLDEEGSQKYIGSPITTERLQSYFEHLLYGRDAEHYTSAPENLTNDNTSNGPGYYNTTTASNLTHQVNNIITLIEHWYIEIILIALVVILVGIIILALIGRAIK
ncbi:MAG: transglutaminase-like domain-containing protein [Desulfurococcaceae archaeon]